MEMGYLTVLQLRLGAKIGDLHAKDSNTFCKRLIAGSGGEHSRYFDSRFLGPIGSLALFIDWRIPLWDDRSGNRLVHQCEVSTHAFSSV